MLREVAVCGLPAKARSRLSRLGSCAAAPAAVVRVADFPNPSAASPPSAGASVAGVADVAARDLSCATRRRWRVFKPLVQVEHAGGLCLGSLGWLT